MSEMKHQTGMIHRLHTTLSLESFCEMLADEHGWEKEDGYYDSWEEVIRDNGYEKYIITGGSVFSIDKVINKDPNDDICEATDQGNGNYSFEVRYYNGGTSMNEMIEDAMNKVANKKPEVPTYTV